jgi:predicted O-methyltransferase YrrM
MSWLAASEAIEGFMSADELSWLYEWAKKMETIVEIGCWKGRSTSALAQGCPGYVYTVDHFGGSPSELDGAHEEVKWGDIFAVAQNNLVPFKNVKILKMPSLDASRLFTDYSVDMVFIDGEHTTEAVLTDLAAWSKKAKKVLCGHDRDFEGVSKALAIFGIPFSPGAGSLWQMEVIR